MPAPGRAGDGAIHADSPCRNALAQTGHPPVGADGWRPAVLRRIRELDWDAVLRDLRPFMERPSDLAQLSPQALEKLLAR